MKQNGVKITFRTYMLDLLHFLSEPKIFSNFCDEARIYILNSGNRKLIMSKDQNDHVFYVAFCFFVLISGKPVVGNSLDVDKQALLELKSFLETQNVINRGRYTFWNEMDPNPCNWPAILCDGNGSRVTGINLAKNKIAGNIYGNFSSLTELSYLDLSANTIGGAIPEDLSRCHNIKFLNLSHNLIDGELNLTGLKSLEILDLSVNRIGGNIKFFISAISGNLVVANFSNNNFIGDIGSIFVGYSSLKYLDLSINNLTGGLWRGFDGLVELSLSENNISGTIPSSFLTENCSLRTLDLSKNHFFGLVPPEISNCRNLLVLNLWDNEFTGSIPKEIGSVSGLQSLYFGSNNFSSDIPDSLVRLSNLTFLDLSGNQFGGDIQHIFGQFKQVRLLLLHENNYTGGLFSSGIFHLPNISWLDLSYNSFSGRLPIEVSQMAGLRFLILAHNQFIGDIPLEYGEFQGIQAIDISFNRLNGSIPSSFGKLSSLLWLMLANNELSGEIPPELGNCSSLLWLNLANNQLSGSIPPQLTNIGIDPLPTFLLNRQDKQIIAGSGECLTLGRWIPANHAPFSFVYQILTRKRCRSIWHMLFTGYGSLFPACASGSNVLTSSVSGYLQLSGNFLAGRVPPEIGKMHNFSILHLGINQFYGKLPPELVSMSLIVLNLTQNNFSGEIPSEIGNIKCLKDLDLSYNNFSGAIPASFRNLNDLSMFNISYNSHIFRPSVADGQIATFDQWSFLGVSQFDNGVSGVQINSGPSIHQKVNIGIILIGPALMLAVLLVVYLYKNLRNKASKYKHLWSKGSKFLKYLAAEESSSSLLIKIMEATENLNASYIIARGALGTVYRVTLSTDRVYALKEIPIVGIEGEMPSMIREIQRLVKVHHPNLVMFERFWFRKNHCLILYSFLKNGNLHDVLHGRIPPPYVKWKVRYKIALGIARGLSYLHFECDPAIVHRDIKSMNILLNYEMQPHISDFGMSMLLDQSTSKLLGSPGYIAPENFVTPSKSKETDVYSYGVLLLELISRKEPFVPTFTGNVHIAIWVQSVWSITGEIGNIVDPSLLHELTDSSVMDQVTSVLLVALRCVQKESKRRPTMKDVVKQLLDASLTAKDGVSYLLNKITEATENFNDQYIIGKGAQGKVYKATLSPDIVYAVKKFPLVQGKGGRRSMMREIQTIGLLQHQNVMKLENFWFGMKYGLILYNYMPNGSLHDVLHETNTHSVPLPWNIRYKIALGTAKGLSYLHLDFQPAIVHRDIKPRNILLDSDLEPYISDFGLAKFADLSADSLANTVLGTVGYLAPEDTFRPKSKESDVYCYGVVLLELVTRRKALDPSFDDGEDIVSWVRSALPREEEIEHIIDPSLLEEFNDLGVKGQVTNVLLLALWCTQKESSKRPSMRDVLRQLSNACPTDLKKYI